MRLITQSSLVARQQMQRRRGARWFRIALVLVACTAVAGSVIRQTLFSSSAWRDDPVALVRGWLAPWMMGLLLTLIVAAAVAGIAAAPAAEEASDIQSMLLAGLSPLAICAGRLTAAIAPALATCGLSIIVWSTAQLLLEVVRPERGGLTAILAAHLLVLIAASVAAAVALCLAIRLSGRGRDWARGMAGALTLATALIGSGFLVDPYVRTTTDPGSVYLLLNAINPLAAVLSAAGKDYPRFWWVYSYISAADYSAAYPAPLASAAIFAGATITTVWLASYRLWRSFSTEG